MKPKKTCLDMIPQLNLFAANYEKLVVEGSKYRGDFKWP